MPLDHDAARPLAESGTRRRIPPCPRSAGHHPRLQKKSVSLAFSGEGKRAVSVGYVVESPIWKTSYRLMLDKGGSPPARLGGRGEYQR